MKPKRTIKTDLACSFGIAVILTVIAVISADPKRIEPAYLMRNFLILYAVVFFSWKFFWGVIWR